jgi:hypothetical protein
VIGVGDRALVGLGALAEIAAVDAHDLARCIAGEAGAGVAQGAQVREGSWTWSGDLIAHSPWQQASGRHIGLA